MGNLRDQLKKANLISKKDAKRLAHEERVHRTKVGGTSGVEAEEAQREAELRRIQEEQRASDRVKQAEVQERRDASAEALACEELLRRKVKKPGRRGTTRWYFALADGRLPFLELPLTERMQLQEGSACIVRTGPPGCHDYGILASDHARRVCKMFPDRVVWAADGALAPVG